MSCQANGQANGRGRGRRGQAKVNLELADRHEGNTLDRQKHNDGAVMM